MLDLRRSPIVALETFQAIVKDADRRSSRPCVRAVSPSAGIGYEDLKAVDPKLVFCTISG
ncbi:hypothetical protein ACU686_03135 [Yinghuangia aomiensis]